MISLTTSEVDDDSQGITLTSKMFKTDSTFNIGAYLVVIILALLYTIFW